MQSLDSSLRFAVVALAAACFLAACSRNSAKVVADGDKNGQDYRKVLAHARERSANERARQEVMQSVQTFRTDLGRLPTNLYEVVRLGYLADVPELSPEWTFRYNTTDGSVHLTKVGQQSGRPRPTR